MSVVSYLHSLLSTMLHIVLGVRLMNSVHLFQSILWDNDIKSTKHTLKEMIMHYTCLEYPEGKAVIKSETLADLA